MLDKWVFLIEHWEINTLASGRFRGFSRKKYRNARGFAQEFIWSD